MALAFDRRARPYILRNRFLGGGNELESEIFGFACQRSQGPFLELFVVLLLTDVRIVAAILHHSVNEEGHFMGGGNEPFWFSEPRTHAAAKSPKCAAAPEQTLGAEAKNISSAIGRLSRDVLAHDLH